MQKANEPSVKKGLCSYCGDASINHAFSIFDNFIEVFFDTRAKKFNKYIPDFLKKFADFVPIFIFKLSAVFGLVKFSSDISKANTFRSKIIWEEAIRRGIKMEQIILWGRPLDHYRAKIHGKNLYFESLPITPEFIDMNRNWDDKIILKAEFSKQNIPVPHYFEMPFLGSQDLNKVLAPFEKPVIVKPRIGSRGRHTITNIHTAAQLQEGIKIVKQICSHVVIEEHLKGYVCRATLVDGVLAGFYQGTAPTVVGDGKKTILELIHEKDKNRPERVEPIRISKELEEHVARSGFTINSVLPSGMSLPLSHRIGRLFGGATKEMLDDLHPSFVPILTKATKIVGLSVVGFDCIIPDPSKDANSQKWGIIECNSLPFIDLHYFALEGKPKNIAGMIWDIWG